MTEAFHKVTGHYPKMDAKDSLFKENEKRGKPALKAEYQMKMADDGRTYSEEFRKKYSAYVNSAEEWKKVMGTGNFFTYSKFKKLNREIFD